MDMKKYVVSVNFVYWAKNRVHARYQFEQDTVTPKKFDTIGQGDNTVETGHNRNLYLDELPVTFTARDHLKRLRDKFAVPDNAKEVKVFQTLESMLVFMDAVDELLGVKYKS